jgi:hypothetical protein
MPAKGFVPGRSRRTRYEIEPRRVFAPTSLRLAASVVDLHPPRRLGHYQER